VYGDVSLGRLMSDTSASSAFYNGSSGGEQPGAYTTPTGTFAYSTRAFANQGETFTPMVQETRDPVAVTTAFNVAGSLDAALIPGRTWSVNTIGGGESVELFFNGSASCYGTAPLLKPGA
jgi:hypothetical protein